MMERTVWLISALWWAGITGSAYLVHWRWG